MNNNNNKKTLKGGSNFFRGIILEGSVHGCLALCTSKQHHGGRNVL
jgi:hypothetical protein